MAITPDDILKYCLDNFEGLVEVNSWGERGVFYNPGGVLKRGVYVLTIKEKDGDNDHSALYSLNCRDARIKVVLWICRMTLLQRMSLCRIRSMRGWGGFAL